jgi:hypothetical protein
MDSHSRRRADSELGHSLAVNSPLVQDAAAPRIAPIAPREFYMPFTDSVHALKPRPGEATPPDEADRSEPTTREQSHSGNGGGLQRPEH